jgi:hypothetical protein
VISSYQGVEVQTLRKGQKVKQKPVCVIHYNQYMDGAHKKNQVLQMYPVKRKKMNKWYMKLF